MIPHGLAWRVGLPFLLLVLVVTATLAVFTSAQIRAEDRRQFEELAGAGAAFLEQSGLSPSLRLASDLGRVTGFDVHFRDGDGLLMPGDADRGAASALRGLPPDGRARQVGAREAVATPLPGGGALVFVHAVEARVFDSRMWTVLGTFWLLAGLVAWFAVRNLVGPLRELTAKLPRIGAHERLEVPSVARNDELGDLARALEEVHGALRSERELRLRSEKMAVLGRMATALAHEIQNPVAAIQMQMQLLAGGDPEESAETATRIVSEAARIEGLVNQWMFLGRPEPPVLERHGLRGIVVQVVEAQRARLEHARVEVRIEGDEDPAVACDRRRLQQVFGNLVVNAAQAMPRGGTLRIAVGSAVDGRARAVVDDEGGGFSEEALRRVGEFFFSTREGGMGIGLAVAREIVHAHGGELEVANRAEGGARVVVSLPEASAADGAGAETPEVAGRSAGGRDAGGRSVAGGYR